MSHATPFIESGGVLICTNTSSAQHGLRAQFSSYCQQLGLQQPLGFAHKPNGLHIFLPLKELPHTTTMVGDTLNLCHRFGLDSLHQKNDLECEILLALLLSPNTFEFPDLQEFQSALRMRRDIVLAARATELEFHTSTADRPAEYWCHSEEQGFTIRPGCSMIEALQAATQPEIGARRYAFSCYRASEYVILLALAQELARSNPALLHALQRQCEMRVISSRRFHDVFLREYGSMEAPLPARYYVPGDRLWFRNPDEYSSDASGYEGSWVFYLGNGLFSNFWNRAQPFTLQSKCVEIFHWRHATYQDHEGELRIDETQVAEHTRRTLHNPQQLQQVLQRMLRYREPRGQYTELGGCLDTTRECPRWIHPGTTDLILPDL